MPDDKQVIEQNWSNIHQQDASWRKKLIGDINDAFVVPRCRLCRLLRHVRKPDVGMVGPVTNWTGNEARIDVGYSDIKDMDTFARAWTHSNEGKCFDIRITRDFLRGNA